MKFFAWGLAAMLAAARLWGQDEPTPEEFADPNFLKNNRNAQIIEWGDPTCPPEVISEGKVVFARVRFVIEPDGSMSALRVTGGNDERYQEAVQASLKRWKFSAELRKGKPARSSREIQFRFDPQNPPKRRDPRKSGGVPYTLEMAPVQGAVERSCPDPVYPKELEVRRLAGTVTAQLAIDETGRVTRARILRSSYAGFTAAALRAVAAWEFTPASQGGDVPVKGSKESLLTFMAVDPETGLPQREAWLQRNGIKLHTALDQRPEEYFDQQPTALVMVDPIYPYELAQEGTAGTARVTFMVDRQGRIQDVAVAEASDPRFGEAVVAAISGWVFEPLNRGGDVVDASFSLTWKFAVPDPAREEYRLLQPEAAAAVAPMGEIDGKLVPVCRVPPVYPPQLKAEKITGEADIEVFIDRDGQVRWPRVKKASQPAFGWAAATAAAQWFFEVPKRGKQPVDVRVVIPFRFKLEDEEPAGAQ